MTKLLHLLLIWKEYITHIQVLAVHVKEYLPFVHKTSIENSEYRGFKVAYVIHFFIFIFLILVFFPLWLSPFWEIWTILLSLSLLTFLQPQRGCFFSSHSFWLFFCWLEWSLWSFKGNPNFQGILNWMIKILHYYCRKQHKDIENSRIIEENVAILCSSLCLLRLALPSPFSMAGYFQFLDTVLNVTSDHSCCI